MCTRLFLTAVAFLGLQAICSGEAARVFTDKDLQRYERGQRSAGGDATPAGEGNLLRQDVETWLDLSEIGNLIEQTKGERDRTIARLTREMEAERMQCTGIVGAEYWSGGVAHGVLVDPTARKTCELAVERKYDKLIDETWRAAEERIQDLSAHKRGLEVQRREIERLRQ